MLVQKLVVRFQDRSWQVSLGDHLLAGQPTQMTAISVASTLAHAAHALRPDPLGWIYQALLQQSDILAYIDLFASSAIMCFAMVSLIFLFAPVKGGGALSTGD